MAYCTTEIGNLTQTVSSRVYGSAHRPYPNHCRPLSHRIELCDWQQTCCRRQLRSIWWIIFSFVPNSLARFYSVFWVYSDSLLLSLPLYINSSYNGFVLNVIYVYVKSVVWWIYNEYQQIYQIYFLSLLASKFCTANKSIKKMFNHNHHPVKLTLEHMAYTVHYAML